MPLELGWYGAYAKAVLAVISLFSYNEIKIMKLLEISQSENERICMASDRCQCHKKNNALSISGLDG